MLAGSALPARRPGSRTAPPRFLRGDRAPHLPLLLGDGEPKERAGARPLADSVLLEHRGRRVRAARLRDRSRARLVLARRCARPDADDAALLLERAAGAAAARRHRPQGLLLPLPRHGDRRPLPRRRTVERRHHHPADGRCCSPANISTARIPPSAKSGSSRTQSTRARTGTSSARDGRTAISMGWHPESGPDPGQLGRLSTRACSSTSSRSARRRIRGRRTCGISGPRPIRRFWRGDGPTRRLAFAPLFGHQYSHIFIDFRGIRDAPMRAAGFDYFENSRRETYANRA